MKRMHIILIGLLLLSAIVIKEVVRRQNESTVKQNATPHQGPDKPKELAASDLYLIDFSLQPDGSAVEWLRGNGFEFKLDFEKLNPTFRNGCLQLSTERPVAGVCGLTFGVEKEIAGAKKARITWGVERHPEGANWERQVNRMGIGVMISFGQERLPSGLPFGVMNAPYFICPFLCKDEPEGKLYTGQYWKEGGRYLSVKPTLGSPMTITDVDLGEQFSKAFSGVEIPAISAVGFQMNTKDTMGIATAFIRKIEFLRE